MGAGGRGVDGDVCDREKCVQREMYSSAAGCMADMDGRG